MVIDEEVLESDAAVSPASRRRNGRRAVLVGAACLVAAGAAVLPVLIGSGGSDSLDGPRTSVDPTVYDDVNEPAIAEPDAETTRRSRDDVVRDLVARGVVPAATLDDGTRIIRPGLNVPPTRDDVVRDLVARGVVPAATLDDGTRITTP